MNFMPEMMNERKVALAAEEAFNAFTDAAGNEAEGFSILIAAMRKDRDVADGLAMIVYRQLAASINGERDGVGAGPVACATAAEAVLPASTPTNSGAMGHSSNASDRGLTTLAPAPLPERGEEGHPRGAPQGAQKGLPSSPPPLSKNTGGAGHPLGARERLNGPARPPVPHSTRHLSVVEKTRNAIATGILAKHRLHDGKIYTELYGRELPYYQTKAEPMAIQHLIIKTIRRDYPTIDPNKRLGEEGSNTLSRASLENIIKHAEEVIRAVA